MRFLLLLSLSFCFVVRAPQAQADRLLLREQISSLLSRDVATMLSVEHALCCSGEEAVPELIAQLDTDICIVPSNQPGTGGTMYIGHGGIPGCYPFISYGLNQSQVRTGWLLEKITFEDFGFGTEPYTELTAEERHTCVSRAKAWWEEQGSDSTRLEWLREAIFSDSGVRQSRAIYYLRQPDSSCQGLTRSYVQTQLLPRISEIARTGQTRYEGARSQACSLIRTLPNGHSYNIRGVAPGMPASQATAADASVNVTCEKGYVHSVDGDTLWEGDRLILQKGATRAEMAPYLPPDSPPTLAGDIDYEWWVGENCEVWLEIHQGRLLTVTLGLHRLPVQPDYTQTR